MGPQVAGPSSLTKVFKEAGAQGSPGPYQVLLWPLLGQIPCGWPLCPPSPTPEGRMWYPLSL